MDFIMKTAFNCREILGEARSWRSFSFFSANLQHLMPDIPFERHPACFLEAYRYAGCAKALDGVPCWGLEDVEGLGRAVAGWRSGIIACYHMGPYRKIGQVLAGFGLPLTLVLTADVAQSQGDFYRELYGKGREQQGNEADGLECLLAEDPMVFRKMLNALRRGRFLLVYVDGQSGVRAKADGRATLAVDLLAGQVRVRTGVADLARLAQVSIYPVMASFGAEDVPVFRSMPVMHCPAPSADRQEWASHCMGTLFGYLQREARDNPMQWEGWFYIHTDLVGDQEGMKGGLLKYYMPFTVGGQSYLLEKATWHVFPIPESLHEKIRVNALNDRMFSVT